MAAISVAAGWDLFAAFKLWQLWSLISTDDLSVFSSGPIVTKTGSVTGWSILFALHALTVTLIVWLFRDRSMHERKANLDTISDSGWNRIDLSKKAIGSCALLLLLTSVGFFFYELLPPPTYSSIRKIVVGKPNRYPDIVSTGRALSTNVLITGWSPANPGATLAGKIQAQAKHFDNVELWLQAENCFSIDWNSFQFDLEQPLDSGSCLRDLSRVLSIRALQSLSEGRHDDVVADGLLSLKLAEKVAIDGNFTLSLIGSVCEEIGVETIVSGIAGASSEQLEKAANQIDETIALFGTTEAEMERLVRADSYFMANANSFYWLDFLMLGFSDDSPQDSIRYSLVHRNVMRNLLRTEIAIRLYRSEFGQFPNDLESLIPDYLSQIPNDGNSKFKMRQPFHYKVSASRESYKLYSVGADGDDDNGWVLEQDADQIGTQRHEGDLDLMILYGKRLVDNAKKVAEYRAELEAIKRWKEELDAMDDEGWEDPSPQRVEGRTEEPNDD